MLTIIRNASICVRLKCILHNNFVARRRPYPCWSVSYPTWMLECLLHKVWKMIPMTICWTTWKDRKLRIFEDREMSFQDLKFYSLRTWYTWSQILRSGINLTILDFVDNIIHESLRAWFFFWFALLYMGRSPGLYQCKFCLLIKKGYLTCMFSQTRLFSEKECTFFGPEWSVKCPSPCLSSI